MRPFVGGKAAGEADGEHVRVESVERLDQVLRVFAPYRPFLLQAFLHEIDQFVAAAGTDACDFLFGYILYFLPLCRVGNIFMERRTEIFAEEAFPFRMRPGGQMHPVRHIAYRHFLGIVAGIERREHFLGNLPVDAAYPVHA